MQSNTFPLKITELPGIVDELSDKELEKIAGEFLSISVAASTIAVYAVNPPVTVFGS